MAVFWIVSRLTILSYMLLGSIIIGSILYGSVGWMINLVVGCFCMLFALFLYLKCNVVRNLHRELAPNNTRSMSKIVTYEIWLYVGVFVIGIVLLSASYSRVFGEQSPVFG